MHAHTYIQSGQFNEDMIPTVGFNMRKVTKGNVTIKVSVAWLSVINSFPHPTIQLYVCTYISNSCSLLSSTEVCRLVEELMQS